MAKAKLEVGDTFTKNGEKFEITHVSANSDKDGTPVDFVYEARLASEAEAIRERNEKARAKAEKALAGLDTPKPV